MMDVATRWDVVRLCRTESFMVFLLCARSCGIELRPSCLAFLVSIGKGFTVSAGSVRMNFVLDPVHGSAREVL